MSLKRIIIVIFIVIIVMNLFLIYAYTSQPTSTNTSDDLNAVAWKPDDSYAIIVGDHGTVLRYDGENFKNMHAPTTETLWDVAWTRDGGYAIIVGSGGTILLWNNSEFVEIENYLEFSLFGVTWQNNTVAFMVGESGTVFRLEEDNLTILSSRTSNDLRDIEWYIDGDYGLIVGENGTVIKEYWTDYQVLQSNITFDLWKVSWRPFHSEALMVGEEGTAIIYNHLGPFNILSTGVSNWLTDVSWQSDGQQALVVGAQGLLLKYNGKDFSREISATSGYLGGVDWKNHEKTALLVGGNGVVRKYPNIILSPEMIIIIWYAEIFLGIGAGVVLLYNYFTKRNQKEITAEKTEKMLRSKGNVKIASAIGLDETGLFYKVRIENKTSFPISDITVKPFLSKEIFILDRDENKLALIRSNDSKVIKFRLRPKPQKQGEAEVLGRINYYEPEMDGYEERLLKARSIKTTIPELTGRNLEENEWEGAVKGISKMKQTITDIPLSGEKCTKYILEVLKDKNLSLISHSIKEQEIYEERVTFFAVDEDGLNYGCEIYVSAGEKDEIPSQIKMVTYVENKETLVGFHYLLLDGIENELDIIEKDLAMLRHVADFRTRIEEIEMGIADEGTILTPRLSEEAIAVMGPNTNLYNEFERLRKKIETIEKEKIGVNSKYKSLYELDELYRILAEDLVKRKVIDLSLGEEIVKKRLDKRHLEDIQRFEEAYALLCEAETSESVLTREDFPNSGKKAILLVYFNAVEIYIRKKLKELIPKGVTILLGEDYGHINTRKKDWEKIWATLSLGSCIHIINNNKYLFLKNEVHWKKKVETLMHQVRELRNTVAHPSKKNPDPRLVRKKVYELFRELPEILKTRE